MMRRALLLSALAMHAALVESREWETQQRFAFLAIGDYGGHAAQAPVAAQLDIYKAKVHAELVVGVGDNFYPDGVESTEDEQWQQKWYKVYKENSSNMMDVPWHAVLGNHDYCKNAKAQIDFKQHGWRMDDFHWIHRFTVRDQQVAFVYIDTNLLAYGLDTEDWLKKDCPNMERQFRQYARDPKNRWSEEEHLAHIKEMLEYVQDAHWILVFGHHPVGGGPCGTEGRLGELMGLFETYRVSAYIYGHVHAMSYGSWKGVAYVMTGAGSDRTRGVCAFRPGVGVGNMWSLGKMGGFVYAKMFDNRMSFTFVDETGKELYTGMQWRR